MKSHFLLSTTFALLAAAHAQPNLPAPATYLIEAEDFQFHGDWQKNGDGGALATSMLITNGADSDAITVVALPKSGNYTMWVRARDYATDPGTRRYKIALNDVLFAPEFGAHGTNGWRWEKAGTRQLDAGDHVLAIRDTARFFGRCDALVFTTDPNFDPNTQSNPALAAKRIAPRKIDATLTTPFAPVAEMKAGAAREVARLENALVRIRFLSSTDNEGKTQITRETALKSGANVQVIPGQNEKLWLQFAPKTEIQTRSMLPAWETPNRPAPKYDFQIGGKNYVATESGNNPFWAAAAQALVSRSAKLSADKKSVEVGLEAPDGTQATGRWELAPGARDAKFSLQMTAPQDGFYSVGFAPFGSHERENVQFNLLPPLFQYQRLPQSPVMVPSHSTPQPLAIVQIPNGASSMTLGVAADPARLPFEWATPNNPVYGFSLLNAQKGVQPTIFTPVLGTPRSNFKAGQPISLGWRVISHAGDWKGAVEYASEKIFEVKDYRKPHGVSMSDAASNMIGLIKSDFESGWDPFLKGFINIEAKKIASQASPLTVVSAAILSRDEELYRTRALPTIEYTLSRPGAHFGLAVPDTHPAYINEAGTKIKVPSDFFGTAYWQGLHDLLGRANTWLPEIAAPNGESRHRTAYSSMPKWSETLAVQRLKPSDATLKQVVDEADAWMKSDLYGRKTGELGLSPFYNMSFYPYWWDLLDLYELTRDKKYLDAAEVGAFNTVAGLWSHPRVPPGNVTIHQNGEYTGDFHMWWRDDKPYRLGYPRVKGDTPRKERSGVAVSQMGLGLEQPSTYYGSGNGNMRNIMMSAWAPNLFAFASLHGREIYRTYARNTVISRLEIIPVITNRTHRPALDAANPAKGPDVTSIYYHHIRRIWRLPLTFW
jgi:hypothetical protein